jgi:hypothetical protein
MDAEVVLTTPEEIGRLRFVGWTASLERSRISFARYPALETIQKAVKGRIPFASNPGAKNCPPRNGGNNRMRFFSH